MRGIYKSFGCCCLGSSILSLRGHNLCTRSPIEIKIVSQKSNVFSNIIKKFQKSHQNQNYKNFPKTSSSPRGFLHSLLMHLLSTRRMNYEFAKSYKLFISKVINSGSILKVRICWGWFWKRFTTKCSYLMSNC